MCLMCAHEKQHLDANVIVKHEGEVEREPDEDWGSNGKDERRWNGDDPVDGRWDGERGSIEEAHKGNECP